MYVLFSVYVCMYVCVYVLNPKCTYVCMYVQKNQNPLATTFAKYNE